MADNAASLPTDAPGDSTDSATAGLTQGIWNPIETNAAGHKKRDIDYRYEEEDMIAVAAKWLRPETPWAEIAHSLARVFIRPSLDSAKLRSKYDQMCERGISRSYHRREVLKAIERMPRDHPYIQMALKWVKSEQPMWMFRDGLRYRTNAFHDALDALDPQRSVVQGSSNVIDSTDNQIATSLAESSIQESRIGTTPQATNSNVTMLIRNLADTASQLHDQNDKTMDWVRGSYRDCMKCGPVFIRSDRTCCMTCCPCCNAVHKSSIGWMFKPTAFNTELKLFEGENRYCCDCKRVVFMADGETCCPYCCVGCNRVHSMLGHMFVSLTEEEFEPAMEKMRKYLAEETTEDARMDGDNFEDETEDEDEEMDGSVDTDDMDDMYY